MGVIIFNGISSKDLHVEVQVYPDFAIPKRDLELLHVPGRSGDVIIPSDSFQNVRRKYAVLVDGVTFSDRLPTAVTKVTRWLSSVISVDGYARLEDSYEPQYYRMACFDGSPSILNALNQVGTFDLEFNCKPQKYLKSGERTFTIRNGQKFHNPTFYASEPVIKITGTGNATITFGGYHITISDIKNNIVIDSKVKDCYSASSPNRNGDVTVPEFPLLKPGDNLISWTGNITKFEMIPNYYEL